MSLSFDARREELDKMRDILRRHGWEPDGATVLHADHIGPVETTMRAQNAPRTMGALDVTHRIGRLDPFR